MNDLSWFIYLADVSESFKGSITGGIALSLIALTIVTVSAVSMNESGATKENWKTWRRLMIGTSSLFFTFVFLYPFVPEKHTVYAIAASEMGEELLKTETVGKVHQALDNWLDEQLEGGTDNEM